MTSNPGSDLIQTLTASGESDRIKEAVMDVVH